MKVTNLSWKRIGSIISNVRRSPQRPNIIAGSIEQVVYCIAGSGSGANIVFLLPQHRIGFGVECGLEVAPTVPIAPIIV